MGSTVEYSTIRQATSTDLSTQNFGLPSRTITQLDPSLNARIGIVISHYKNSESVETINIIRTCC